MMAEAGDQELLNADQEVRAVEEEREARELMTNLLETARYGDAIRREVTNSKAVGYILVRAKQEKLKALEKLVDADPTNVPEITRLQNEVKRFNDMNGWLNDAIHAGEAAENSVIALDRDDDQD